MRYNVDIQGVEPSSVWHGLSARNAAEAVIYDAQVMDSTTATIRADRKGSKAYFVRVCYNGGHRERGLVAFHDLPEGSAMLCALRKALALHNSEIREAIA